MDDAELRALRRPLKERHPRRPGDSQWNSKWDSANAPLDPPSILELPGYDIGELLLAGVFICGAMISFIAAGAAFVHRDWHGFMKSAGLCLTLLGGMAHPKKYILDCITFPGAIIREKSGRETPVTVVAGLLGVALSGAGFVLAHWR